jgi:hypothetical protein
MYKLILHNFFEKKLPKIKDNQNNTWNRVSNKIIIIY